MKRRKLSKRTSSPENCPVSLSTDQFHSSDKGAGDCHVDKLLQPPSDLEPGSNQVNSTDMHIKKLRILGNNIDGNNSHGDNLVVGNSSLAATAALPAEISRSSANLIPSQSAATAAAHEKLYNPNRIDKLSDSSVDGCSSGYSSATTNESTTSPRDKDGHRLPYNNHSSMNALPHSSRSTPTSTVVGLNSTPTAANVAALHAPTNPSPLTARSKNAQDAARSASSASPSVTDRTKQSPVVPYRDPELLKRDADVRKMQQPSTTSAPPQAPTSRTLPTSSSLGSLPQAPVMGPLPTPLLNPMTQHMVQQQVFSQMMLEQYRQQLHALQGLSPLQMSLMQQPHIAAAAQQQMMLDSLYPRHAARPGLPPAAAQWMTPSFGDKQQQQRMMADLMREHEMRTLDQFER